MGQFYTKGMCPKCHQVTLTTWPLLPNQTKARKTCSNTACMFKEAGG